MIRHSYQNASHKGVDMNETIKRRSIKLKPVIGIISLCQHLSSSSCKAFATATSSEMVEKASIYEDHMNQCI